MENTKRQGGLFTAFMRISRFNKMTANVICKNILGMSLFSYYAAVSPFFLSVLPILYYVNTYLENRYMGAIVKYGSKHLRVAYVLNLAGNTLYCVIIVGLIISPTKWIVPNLIFSAVYWVFPTMFSNLVDNQLNIYTGNKLYARLKKSFDAQMAAKQAGLTIVTMGISLAVMNIFPAGVGVKVLLVIYLAAYVADSILDKWNKRKMFVLLGHGSEYHVSRMESWLVKALKGMEKNSMRNINGSLRVFKQD